MTGGSPSGYSGKPLHEKLGWKPGDIVVTNFNGDYMALCGGAFETEPWDGRSAGRAHLFFTSAAEMERALSTARRVGGDLAVVWVSWPKKSSLVPTDISEQTIRDVALPMGWVDVKVCAVDETWSALKLVVRKSERG